MNTIEAKYEDPQVGELKVVRDRSLDESASNCCDDCADPGTGSDSCGCED